MLTTATKQNTGSSLRRVASIGTASDVSARPCTAVDARGAPEEKTWLAIAAHELRSPLGAIRGIAEFLRDGAGGEMSPTQRQLVDTIHDTSATLLDLVAEILDLTVEDGSGPDIRLHDLVALVERRVATMNLEAAGKRSEIRCEAAVSAARAAVDAAKIGRVVDNLLSNAVKYSPPGSTIAARVGFGAEPGTVKISVRDQGPGIPAAERHKLFVGFSRLSTKPTGGEKSTGLGLAICRKIVELHAGRIDVENLPAGGAEFSVTLPIASPLGLTTHEP
jgi:signal transduction histidine kinase